MSNLATLMRRHNELDHADFSKQAGVPFITHTLCNVVWRKDTAIPNMPRACRLHRKMSTRAKNISLKIAFELSRSKVQHGSRFPLLVFGPTLGIPRIDESTHEKVRKVRLRPLRSRRR